MKNFFNEVKFLNSIFNCQKMIPVGLYADVIDVRGIMLREMTIEIADGILKRHPNAITEKEVEGIRFMKIELMVFEKPDFKRIVEAAIGMLSDEQIANIRNGIEVL